MSADPNKKSPRTFQCRDALWETFEQLARELECSVDYLINEAMKQYARQRASARTPLPGTNRAVTEGSDVGPPPAGLQRLPAAVTRPLGPAARIPAPPRTGAPPPLPAAPPTAVPLPPLAQPPVARPPTAAPPQNVASRPPAMPPMPRTVPPPVAAQPRPAPTPPPAPPPLASVAPPPFAAAPLIAPQAATLSIIYQGEKFPVTKERFIIGRGKQSSDLTLKDPNVSRQHAMVEYHSGVFFMVDMGSTNGVEYNGQRIARKQIGEGDTFRICDHDLVFTFL